MKRIIGITTFLLLFATASYACSCINIPLTFVKNIKANHIIASVEVIEHIEVPAAETGYSLYYGLTKLKVIKWYQNKMKSDTIYYANGPSATCINSLESTVIGEKMIIKVLKRQLNSIDLYSRVNDAPIIDFLKIYKDKPIVGYGICDCSILLLKGGSVTGNITKNYAHRKYEFEQFAGKISKKWAARLAKKRQHKPQKKQKMSLDKFAKLMERKWRNLI